MDKLRNTRPVTLPILKLHLPLAGWASLLHRVSGVLLFLALPVVLYALDMSLRSQADYEFVLYTLAFPLVQLAVLLLVWALTHHLFAGFRHIFMDMHWGISLHASRRSARVVLIASLIVTGLTAWSLFA